MFVECKNVRKLKNRQTEKEVIRSDEIKTHLITTFIKLFVTHISLQLFFAQWPLETIFLLALSREFKLWTHNQNEKSKPIVSFSLIFFKTIFWWVINHLCQRCISHAFNRLLHSILTIQPTVWRSTWTKSSNRSSREAVHSELCNNDRRVTVFSSKFPSFVQRNAR